MNKKFFTFLLGAIGIILIISVLIPNHQSKQIPQTNPDIQQELRTAMLIVDYGNENRASYPVELNGDSTAFSILKDISEKENIKLDTQQYDFGVYVISIGDKQSSEKMAWIYFVNGESGTIAADQMKVNPGDTIEWKYIPPTE